MDFYFHCNHIYNCSVSRDPWPKNWLEFNQNNSFYMIMDTTMILDTEPLKERIALWDDIHEQVNLASRLKWPLCLILTLLLTMFLN